MCFSVTFYLIRDNLLHAEAVCKVTVVVVACLCITVVQNVSIPSVYIGRRAGQFFLHDYIRLK